MAPNVAPRWASGDIKENPIKVEQMEGSISRGFNHEEVGMKGRRKKYQDGSIINNKFANYITFILLNHLVSLVGSLTVPDQQAIIGRLFYYRLPLNESQLEAIQRIDIREEGGGGIRNGNGSIPTWLWFNKGEKRMELVGFPLQQHKKLHFFHLTVLYKKNKERRDDVFILDVTDPPTNLIGNEIQSPERECILRISATFGSPVDLWNVIYYLIPGDLIPDLGSDPERVNLILNTWAKSLFTFTPVSQYNKIDPGLLYHLTMDNQLCDSKKDIRQHEMVRKLKQLGLDYNLIKIARIHEPKTDEDVEYNFIHNLIQPSNTIRFELESRTLVNRHRRRQAPNYIYNTPEMVPDWMTLSTRTFNEPETDQLTRIVPSLLSPSISMTSAQTTPVIDRPHYQYTPFVYSTPEYHPELPTMIESEGLIEPTPTLRFIPSSTLSIEVSPSPTMKPPEATDEVTTMKTNDGPKIKKRLGKLRFMAGKYKRYRIPEETFYDKEDGGTRMLNVELFKKKITNDDYQALDLTSWLRFDTETQELYGLPTEDDLGIQKFIISVRDSSGAFVEDIIQVQVTQDPKIKNFNHIFMFYDVALDWISYATKIDSVIEMGKRVANMVGDDSIDAISFQIIKEERDNSWTIGWTNDSLPTRPCPKEEIHRIYTKIADIRRSSDSPKTRPANELLMKLFPTFTVSTVGLRLMGTCKTKIIKPMKPQLRNPIDLLEFRLGQIIEYQIQEDMFFAGEGLTTRNLELSLLYSNGEKLKEDSYLFLDPKTQILHGLTLDKNDLGRKEFQLQARIPNDGGSISDVFYVEIFGQDDVQYPFEASMSLIPKGKADMDMKAKLHVSEIISKEIFDMKDSSNLMLIDVKKVRFDLYRKFAGSQGQDEDEMRRGKRQTLESHYYQVTWTNISKEMTAKGCPIEEINSNVVRTLFSQGQFKKIQDKFESNYELLNIKLKPTDKCLGYFEAREAGSKPEKVIPEAVTTIAPPLETTRPSIMEMESEPELEKQYLKSVIPAVIVIIVVLILSCIIASMLITYKRRREKNSIDIDMDEEPGKLKKPRPPIILDDELQRQQEAALLSGDRLSNPIVNPNKDANDRTAAIKSLPPLKTSSGEYEAIPTMPPEQYSLERNQPPPYHKL